MRLLIDGRKLGDGGIGVYIENAIIGLLQLGGVEVTVIGSPSYDKSPSWVSAVDWIASDARQYSFKEYFLLARESISLSLIFFMRLTTRYRLESNFHLL